MAQRLEAMEQWGHVRWCVLYCVASGWYVMWAACSGWPHDEFYEVGQQGRLGTTMVYVRCRVLFASRCGFLRYHMDLRELLFRYGGGCIGHQALCAGGLWKRNNIAD